MRLFSFLVGFAFGVGAVVGPVGAASPDPVRTRQLLVVVQSGADLADRARALQQLAPVATAEAVPAMAALLGDEKLGQYARDVLENLPDPSADEALRGALGRLQGRALIGAVNSLGLRRDARAVDALARLAASGDLAVAVPAMLALGRIGTPEARRVIEPAITQGRPELRAAAAEAGLLLAERSNEAGSGNAALYATIRGADLPLPLRVAATRGAMAAPGGGGLTLLIEQLHGTEPEMREVALLMIRELRDPQVTPRLVAELDRLSGALQALVIAALVDRGDPGALAAIEARAGTGGDEVRWAALQALGTVGRGSSLPILLRAASAPRTPAEADVALASLARIPATETNAFLLQALPAAPLDLRVRLIQVLGERRADGAAADLMALAAGSEPETRSAAWRALGLLALPSDLPKLIALAIAARDEATKVLADRAIVTTAMKMLEPARRADPVLAAFRRETDPMTRAALVRPLGAIVRSMKGSHEVFFALRAALKDPAEPVREAALKSLADWPDATPTMPLLELANEKDTAPARREMALGGAIRMATNVAAGRERSPLDVLAAFTLANQAVRTKEEKLMIVSGLGSLRRPEALGMLRPYLDDPAVQTEAGLALLQIAPALAGTTSAPELKALLEKVAAGEKDEDVRRNAARLAKGGPAAAKGGAAAAAKAKGKGKAPVAAAGPELFNGRDLGDWDGDPAVWRVRDGVIVGGSLEGNPRNEFLATRRPYRNFVLRLEYRLTGTEGFVNGGVQIRSARIANPPNEMIGYQADIGAGHSGSLYDESRRKRFLARAAAEQIQRLEKPGDWNAYEIRCDGPRVELWLNGERTLAYTEDDPAIGQDGLIALQIHGKCKAEILFRHLRVEELP